MSVGGIDARPLSGFMLNNEAHCLACADIVMADHWTRRTQLLHAEHRLLTCVRCKRTLEASNATVSANKP